MSAPRVGLRRRLALRGSRSRSRRTGLYPTNAAAQQQQQFTKSLHVFFITYSRKLVKRFLGVPGTRTGALQMVRDPIGFAARYAPGGPPPDLFSHTAE